MLLSLREINSPQQLIRAAGWGEVTAPPTHLHSKTCRSSEDTRRSNQTIVVSTHCAQYLAWVRSLRAGSDIGCWVPQNRVPQCGYLNTGCFKTWASLAEAKSSANATAAHTQYRM